jgi:hypothetical protein
VTAPRTAPPSMTPDHALAPALLRALADVGEVDLVAGLGRRRLAEAIRQPQPPAPPRQRHWLAAVWLLASTVCALLLAL